MKPNFKSLLFLMSMISVSSPAAFAFTLISNAGKIASWPQHKTSYHFNTTTSGYFIGGLDASGTASDEFQPIRNGFQTWMNLPGLDLTITEDASSSIPASAGDHSNTIQWVKTGWHTLSFKPPSNALAVTLISFDSNNGAITDADIYFNAQSFHWAVVDSPSESGYIDVQNIATHEIGHFIGLDHSSESLYEDDPKLADATMYFASSTGETSRRNLHEDDITAAHSLYGNADRGIPQISIVESISENSGIYHYRIHGSGFNEYTTFILTKYSLSEMDVVSRYRTIVSDTEALVEFDAAGLTGAASVVAFNSPDHPSNVSSRMQVGLGNGAGGGGGCELKVQENFSISLIALVFFAFVFTLSLRREVRVAKILSCLAGRCGKKKF